MEKQTLEGKYLTRRSPLFFHVMWEQIQAYVPESALYNRLQNFERNLDTVIARKRVEYQEAVKKPLKASSRCAHFNELLLRLPIPCNVEPDLDGFFFSRFFLYGNNCPTAAKGAENFPLKHRGKPADACG
jgi:hypothetical protein